jgi:hypothetical protein
MAGATSPWGGKGITLGMRGDLEPEVEKRPFLKKIGKYLFGRWRFNEKHRTERTLILITNTNSILFLRGLV